MNCWWGGSSHLVKNASVLSISSCLFSPPHAPIALPSLPPPPTRHILDIFTPFYLHNCLHYPVRKGMSECRGGWPIASLPSAPRLGILFPSPPYYANKKWFVTPLDGHQNRRQSSPHKRTASTICQFQVQQRSLLWWTIQKKWTRICWYYSESSMITSKNVTKIVVLRISGSLLNTILTLIISIF